MNLGLIHTERKLMSLKILDEGRKYKQNESDRYKPKSIGANKLYGHKGTQDAEHTKNHGNPPGDFMRC